MSAYEKADKQEQQKSRRIRLAVLIFILVLISGIGLAHQLMGSLAPVGVDALCPFGGIESAYTLVASGVMLQRIAISSFILLITTIITAIIFRRAFCGQICPLGTLQELSGMLGKKISSKGINVPLVLDKPARYLKYIVLAVVVVFTVITGELVLRPYDPWVAWQHLSGADLFTEFTVGFIILVVTLLGSLFIGRIFCRYLCPMGAFLAMLYPAGWFGVKRNDTTCIKCGICNRECPMAIDIMAVEKVTSVECINCNTCVNVCPVSETMTMTGRTGQSTSPLKMLAAVLLIFAAVVGVTTITGDFKWTTQTLESQVKEKGEFDPEGITGRMTLQEVVDASGIPKEVFKEHFKLTDADFSVPIKELVPKYGFETEAVRQFSEDYLSKNKTKK